MYDFTNQYQVHVLVKDRIVDEYSHDGNVFIEGRPGSEFVINVRNNSYERISAIISVDGISVIDGKPAGYSSPGFVINPMSEERISEFVPTKQGFVFSDLKKNTNAGVIGVMIFREMPQVLRSRADMSIDPNTFYPMVKFQARDPYHPDATMIIYYDEVRGLKRRGIDIKEIAYPAAFYPGSPKVATISLSDMAKKHNKTLAQFQENAYNIYDYLLTETKNGGTLQIKRNDHTYSISLQDLEIKNENTYGRN